MNVKKNVASKFLFFLKQQKDESCVYECRPIPNYLFVFFKSKEPISFKSVLEGCKKNKAAAQKILFEQYFGLAKNICMRYAASEEEADELVTDGFMKVFKNINKFDENLNFEPWLKTILVRTCIDNYRKTKKNNHFIDINEAYTLAADEAILSKISAEEIIKIVQKLPDTYRTVFSLNVMEGYSHAEIAKLLNIEEVTSRSNLSKAKAKLRIYILEYLEEPKIYV